MTPGATIRTAVLLAIGDEIVSGLTVDTNSAYLAAELRALGIEVVGIYSAPDDDDAIERAFRRALDDADLALSTGGLGPTEDDRTAAVAARVAGVVRARNDEVLRAIQERFRVRGKPMPSSNERQALLPRGCTVLPNSIGTAPGFLCETADGHLGCLPGVPSEARTIVTEALLPWLEPHVGARRFESRTFSTFGMSESALGEALEGVVQEREARVAFRAAFPKIQVRITVEGGRGDDLAWRLERIENRVRARLGRALYAVGDEGLEETIGRLLRSNGLTLATAESCTGGLIGHRITDAPGSSDYFLGGIVTYHDSAKVGLLDVRPETLAAHGAVSVETAEEMARGVRERVGADIGVATTGIAGPGGGSAEKPVGTVCISIAAADTTWSKRYDLGDIGRSRIKELTAQIALNRVRLWVGRD